MLIAEYDYDTDMRVKQEEAWENGLEAGKARGTQTTKLANAKNLLKLKLLSPEQIAEAIQLPLEDVKKLALAVE